MGGTYHDADWAKLGQTQRTYASAGSAQAAWKSSKVHESLNPALFKGPREVRNAPACPASTPIILGLDVTGSMDQVAFEIAQKGLGVMIKEIYDRKPVTDPQIAFAGIDDVHVEPVPIQFSQFEGDARLLDQLENLCITHNGGGNGSETYNGIWHIAATRIEADCWKDGRKGFLFTFGDEGVPPDLTSRDLGVIYGNVDMPVLTNDQLLAMLEDKFYVFHIVVCHGGRGDTPEELERDFSWAIQQWKQRLGERALVVTDHTKIGEVVVSTMQILAGADKDKVVKSWSGDTSLAVARAVGDLTVPGVKSSGGLVRF